MKILGLHFGHDASVCVLNDGVVAAHVVRERVTRARHCFGLDLACVHEALKSAGVGLREIDACAVTSTQQYEVVTFDQRDIALSSVAPEQRDWDVEVGVLEAVYARQSPARNYRTMFPEQATRRLEDIARFKPIDDYQTSPAWQGLGLDDIAARDWRDVLDDNAIQDGQAAAIAITIDGIRLPAHFVQHHVAHGASAFYSQPKNEALVLTLDGWSQGGPNGGLFLHGEGERLRVMCPHDLPIGRMYDEAGVAVGFDLFGAAGKLMGLAPYGTPKYVDARFAGNLTDLARRGVQHPVQAWLEHCDRRATALNQDRSGKGVPDRVLEPVNADLAASTQALFENAVLQAARSLKSAAERSGLKSTTLCVSGGGALNCPANSALAASGLFESVVINPDCDDSGLSAGAARYVHHHVLHQPRRGAAASHAYRGRRWTGEEVEQAINRFRDRVTVHAVSDPAADAAARLADGHIIGWFEGRSEVGPRALGHRSILADPRRATAWSETNRVKRREHWRPFAPAVLLEHLAEWFETPLVDSPFMLFTVKVRQPDRMPAISHVDGTARVQTVDASAGGLHRLLQCFHAVSGVPAVLNTSFNGPGEPIVDGPADALNCFLKLGLDCLYLEGNLVLPAGASRVQRGS